MNCFICIGVQRWVNVNIWWSPGRVETERQHPGRLWGQKRRSGLQESGPRISKWIWLSFCLWRFSVSRTFKKRFQRRSRRRFEVKDVYSSSKFSTRKSQVVLYIPQREGINMKLLEMDKSSWKLKSVNPGFTSKTKHENKSTWLPQAHTVQQVLYQKMYPFI